MKKLIPLLFALAALSAQAQGDASTEAFSQPLSSFSDTEREQFFRGRTLVRQSWVAAPSKDEQFDGLGPLYNRLACISCHPRNGRGRPPEAADERMLSMLVRLSVPGKDAHGGPKPHPAYGGQLNEEGIPGVPGEGRATLTWREVATVRLAGGEKVSLRAPTVRFSELAYGPIAGVLSSLRVGEQMVGMGYLDAVPAETLEAMAKEAKPDGVKGRVNRVWNPETKRVEAGRFGYKSNMPTLRAQSAGAFNGDIGITSPLFPDENCTPAQKACQEAPNGGAPELTAQQLDEVEFYLAHLAVPPRRDEDSAKVSRGGTAFAQAGCAACHRPELKTDPQWRFSRLAGQSIHPYTDLLVHDMGEGLSDRRPDGLASGREWRTSPLWGLGLTRAVSEAGFYLHDGRARNLVEAIVWHGGEAKRARDRFVRMAREEREALLAFLESL
jgi:CxxC motif-containing protein (DUF1111 family)